MDRLPEKPSDIKRLLGMAMFFCLLLASGLFTDFSLRSILDNLDQAWEILDQMFFPPDLRYMKRLWAPMEETIQTSIVGCLLGAVAAVPLAIFSARNSLKTQAISRLLRVFLSIFRTIPALVFAALFTAVFGFGSFAGMLALFCFTTGLVAKLLYEAIENIETGPVEALEASGADALSVLRFAIWPQVFPQYLGFVLYAFEINVRASAVLGYVGAGGIAEYYDRSLSYLRYDKAGSIVLLSFLVVLFIDLLSSKLRESLVS